MADIVYDTASLPGAFLGEPYEAAIAYHGAATALTAASATGLPAGLSLVTSALGIATGVRITGTPTQTGLFSVAVSLTDTAGQVTSSALSLAVYGSPNDATELYAMNSPAQRKLN